MASCFIFTVARKSCNCSSGCANTRKTYPVQLIGLDERRYAGDYANSYAMSKANTRDERMARVVKRHMARDAGRKGMIWAHDSHVAAHADLPEFAQPDDIRHMPMGEHLRGWYRTDYRSVAMLFGSGYFNAALIAESGAVDNSRMVRHYARPTSKYFWEKKLSKTVSEPAFITDIDLAALAGQAEIHYKRALGWGVKRSDMHDRGNVKYVALRQAYDAVVFFPRVTAAHLL